MEVLDQWLMSLDPRLPTRLVRYRDKLITEFDADLQKIALAARLAEPRFPGAFGHIDPRFWKIAGVRNVGHTWLLTMGMLALP